MKRGFFVFAAGVLIGYCLVQGMALLQSQYLWALFYR